MTQRNPYFDFYNRPNCEIHAWQTKSGEAIVLIAENPGSDKEKSVTIALSTKQWEMLKEAVSKPARRSHVGKRDTASNINFG